MHMGPTMLTRLLLLHKKYIGGAHDDIHMEPSEGRMLHGVHKIKQLLTLRGLQWRGRTVHATSCASYEVDPT